MLATALDAPAQEHLYIYTHSCEHIHIKAYSNWKHWFLLWRQPLNTFCHILLPVSTVPYLIKSPSFNRLETNFFGQPVQHLCRGVTWLKTHSFGLSIHKKHLAHHWAQLLHTLQGKSQASSRSTNIFLSTFSLRSLP